MSTPATPVEKIIDLCHAIEGGICTTSEHIRTVVSSIASWAKANPTKIKTDDYAVLQSIIHSVNQYDPYFAQALSSLKAFENLMKE